MKLSELRPCDHCGGPLGACFAVVRFSNAMVMPAASVVLGLNQMMRGNLTIAEALAPDANGAVIVAGDMKKELMTELLLCYDCTIEIRLAQLVEKRNEVDAKTAACNKTLQ